MSLGYTVGAMPQCAQAGVSRASVFWPECSPEHLTPIRRAERMSEIRVRTPQEWDDAIKTLGDGGGRIVLCDGFTPAVMPYRPNAKGRILISTQPAKERK